MSLIKNAKIGADPELFLMTNDEEKKPYPACGLIGGTKEAPVPISERGHALQEDNVMVEFCIPPATTSAELIKDITHVLDHIKVIIPKALQISTAASHVFDPEHLESAQAKMFGCDPSYNHWTLEMNKPPKARTGLRTAGGHIHVGYDDPNDETSIRLLQAMELFLAVPSIIMDPDTERRKMYGKSGEFRFKSYGAEFRVLSNFWIFNSMHISWAFEGVMRAIDFVNQEKEITPVLAERIIHTINNSDRRQALDLCDQYGINHFIHKVITPVRTAVL